MTIYDIAKKFNINISTVSKALSGSTDIAESTRKAICAYADSVGYKTRRARAPKGRFAVLRNNASEDSRCFPKIVDAFRCEAEKENYGVTVLDIGGDFDLEAFLAENQYSGVFVLGTHYNSALARGLKTITVPVVVLGNQLSNYPHVSNVKSDDLVAAGNAVDHLVSLDHNLIAFLGSENDSLIGAERFAGYFFGLSKNALPYRYDLTYFGDSTRQAGIDAAEYFLSYNKYFTAIVCASEESALGFAEYMNRSGKFVPEDISVVCFGDGDGLTSLTPDYPSIGAQAFLALKTTLNGAAQHITVPCSLLYPDASCRRKRTYHTSDAD